jgi:Transposase DDE domain
MATCPIARIDAESRGCRWSSSVPAVPDVWGPPSRAAFGVSGFWAQQLIPKARYRNRNWPAYEAGLKRRGDLALWVDEAAVAGWTAPRRTTPGGQRLYSDVAIQLVLTLQRRRRS